MRRRTTLLLIILAAVLMVSSAAVGFIIGAYPVVDLTERYVVPADHDRAAVPNDVEAQDRPLPAFPSFDARNGTAVFDRITHDPMVVEEDGVYYMIVGTTRGEGQQLYRTDTPSNASSWELADAEYLSDAWEFDAIVETDDRYLIYGNGDVYAAESVATDNWTKVADNTEFRDLGAYYDDETGLVHVYYEVGDAAGYSGKKIGHAVSPNGVNNWTVYPPVWTAPDGYGVGDFAVVERGETLYLFGDYDRQHPRYNVSVWANDNPYTTFTQQDTAAIGFDDDEGVAYGVADPTLVENDGCYYMYANVYPSSDELPSVHQYAADCQ